jgi:hypothetical protein
VLVVRQGAQETLPFIKDVILVDPRGSIMRDTRLL